MRGDYDELLVVHWRERMVSMDWETGSASRRTAARKKESELAR